MATDTRTADRLEIADLFARLNDLHDGLRYDETHTVFTDDAVVRSPRADELRGLEEVTAFLKRSPVEGERTLHTTTDVRTDVDGDTARAAANAFTYFYREGEAPHRTGALRVTGQVRRTPEGWRFCDLRMALAWIREG